MKQAQLDQIKLPKLQELSRMVDILNDQKQRLEQQLEEYATAKSSVEREYLAKTTELLEMNRTLERENSNLQRKFDEVSKNVPPWVQQLAEKIAQAQSFMGTLSQNNLLLTQEVKQKRQQIEEMTKFIKDLSEQNEALKLYTKTRKDENVEDELEPIRQQMLKVKLLLKQTKSQLDTSSNGIVIEKLSPLSIDKSLNGTLSSPTVLTRSTLSPKKK